MGDDISSGSVTDYRQSHFSTIDDIFSSEELHQSENQSKRNQNRCHHPLITQLRCYKITVLIYTVLQIINDARFSFRLVMK